MNRIGVSHEVQHLAKRLPIGIAVQPDANHVLLERVYEREHKRFQVCEELRLLNDNTVGRAHKRMVKESREFVRGESGGAIFVMADNLAGGRVARVNAVRNTDGLLLDTGIPPDNSEDFRGLAGEHGTDVEFKGHFGIV